MMMMMMMIVGELDELVLTYGALQMLTTYLLFLCQIFTPDAKDFNKMTHISRTFYLRVVDCAQAVYSMVYSEGK